ncbi:MAG: hypothetical protein K0R61_1577 [Microvirga sp.]|jgi:hypothetical protein|nr:hypothetical protein [Microvirga sp.]
MALQTTSVGRFWPLGPVGIALLFRDAGDPAELVERVGRATAVRDGDALNAFPLPLASDDQGRFRALDRNGY